MLWKVRIEMTLRILNIRLAIVYRLAKFTNRLSTWFCDKHSKLYHEWEKEFNNYRGDLR